MARKLSEYFTLEEFVFSQTAARKTIDNLKQLAAVLEAIRSLLGDQPIRISSGYHSPALNKAIGGARTSSHMRGLAVDFTAPHFGTVLQTAKKIAGSTIAYDQVICEYGSWVHVGIVASGAAHRENLSIYSGTGYLPGLVTKPA